MNALSLSTPFFAGADIREVTDNQSSANARSMAVNGWAWWFLLSASFNLANAVGGAAARPRINVLSGADLLGTFNSSSAIGAPDSRLVTAGFGLTQTLDVTSITMPIAPLVVMGDGSVVIGFEGGNANTSTDTRVLLIVGQLIRGRREKR